MRMLLWLFKSLCFHVFAVILNLPLVSKLDLKNFMHNLEKSIEMAWADSLEDNRISPLQRLYKLLFGDQVVDAENPNLLFCIPAYIRRDGLVLRLGASTHIQHKPQSFVIKDILISFDLEKAYVNLVTKDSSNLSLDGSSTRPDEELLVDVALLVSAGGTVSRDLAMNGMARIQDHSSTYPTHILRNMRKHQLCSTLRRDVQSFLSGFSIAKAWSLGPVDWRLDPGIFGLEVETGFSLDFHAEKVAHSVSHLDLLLGQSWDVRSVANSAGYRAVLTLELGIDPTVQDIKVQAHAVLCPQELNLANHRVQTLDYLKSSEALAGHTIKSCDNTRIEGGSFAQLGTAKSLTWEEFDSPRDFNISSEECSPQRMASTNNVFDSAEPSTSTSCEPSTSTAHTKALEEVLKMANLNSQNFYFYSPAWAATKKSMKRENSRTIRSTSTPEDELSADISDVVEDFASLEYIEELIPDVTCNRKSMELPGHDCGKNQEIDVEGLSSSDQINNKETAADTINTSVDDNEMKTSNENSVITSKSQIDDISNHIRKVNLNTLFKSSTCDENSEFCSNSNDESLARNDSTSQDSQEESFDDPNSSNELFDSQRVKESSTFSLRPMKMDNPQETKSYNDSFTIGTVIETLEPKMLEADICDIEKCSLDEKNENNNTKVHKSEEPNNCDMKKQPPAALMTAPVTLPDCDPCVREKVSEYIQSIKANAFIEDPRTFLQDAWTTTPGNDSSILSSSSLQTPDRNAQMPSPKVSKSFSDNTHKSIRGGHNVNILSAAGGGDGGVDGCGGEEANSSRDRIMSDEANVSVCSSRSRASRASELGSLTGRLGQGGSAVASMYGVGIAGQFVTPFPDDWQYNTIPEVIENDDEID